MSRKPAVLAGGVSRPVVTQFLRVVKSIEEFWLSIVVLPAKG